VWLARGEDSSPVIRWFVVKVLQSKGPDDHKFLAAKQDVQRFSESLPSLSLNGFIQFVDAQV